MKKWLFFAAPIASEPISTDTGFINATEAISSFDHSVRWSNPQNALTDGSGNAFIQFASTLNGDTLYFNNFTAVIPPSAIINGLEVLAKTNASASNTQRLYVSVNNGTSWSSEQNSTNGWPQGSTVFTTFNFGSSNELWGLTFDAAQFSNYKVGIRVYGTSSTYYRLDYVALKVYYTYTP